MRKLISTVVLLGMFASAPAVSASESVKVFVDNEPIQLDAAPILEQGRVLVPIRAVAESLGADVNWDAKTKTVTARRWSRSARLTVGQKAAVMKGNRNPLAFHDDDANVALDVPVKMANDRVYIPLRSISQIFGYQVKWENNAVLIESPINSEKIWVEGALADSRKFASTFSSSSDLQYLNDPLDVAIQSEDYTRTFLFPEGEALRYYYLFGNTVSLIQFIDEFPVVVWQAHLQGTDPLQQFIEGRFSDQRGTAPTIHKPYLYYSTGFFGDSSWEESGSIDLDHKMARTGYKRTVGGEVTNQEGTISFELPDEKRSEVATP